MKIKLSGLLLGLVFATTFAFAGGSCGAGKCGAEMQKNMKESCEGGKCTAEMQKKMKESCPMNKKDTKGSCGAGKCGTDMKSDSKNEMKDTSTTK